MSVELKKAWSQLKDLLEMIPTDQDNTIHIEALNGLGLSCRGMLKNAALCMDHVKIDANVETIWAIQSLDIHFMILSGAVALHFRLNDNVHVKNLSTKQSLRIPAGVPFMLKTYETSGSLLLISILGENNGGC